jgi:hypothetical protein
MDFQSKLNNFELILLQGWNNQMADKIENLTTAQAEFHFFSKLPIELRQKIVKLAASEPRTVTITINHRGTIYKPSMKVPAILQVNSEFRPQAERILAPSFQTRFLAGGTTFFNFEIDTLSLDLESAENLASLLDGPRRMKQVIQDRERVRHLDVRFDIYWDSDDHIDAMARLICLGLQNSWLGLQSLRFPGCSKDGKTSAKMLGLQVRRPANEEDGENMIDGVVFKLMFRYLIEGLKNEYEGDTGMVVTYI